MTSLALACAFFLGIHVFISGTALRDAIVARIGERPYLGLFSLLSIGAMIWLAEAYRRAPLMPLWGPVAGFRWLALALTLVAFVLVALGLTTPSPTVTFGESRLEVAEPAQGILRVTRHPFLWGVAIWAATHLILNGDVASLLLFGSLLLLALLGPLLIDAKRQRAFGARWERFAAVTSAVPFVAILAGRNHLRLDEIGAWRLGIGIGLYVVMLAIHRPLFGVSPLPG